MPPDVSVIIPAFNAAATIGDTLDCLARQRLETWEAIVVDDGSTDDTAAIVRGRAETDARIRLLSTENGGVSTARNRGIAAASARHLNFLDADDWYPPNFLKRTMAALRGPDAPQAVYTDYARVTVERLRKMTRRPLRNADQQFPLFCLHCPIVVHSVVLDRAVLDRTGTFDSTYRMAEDWDLWMRMARCGVHFRHVPGTEAAYRMGAVSATTNTAETMENCLRVIRLARSEDPRLTDPAPAFRHGHRHPHSDEAERIRIPAWFGAREIAAAPDPAFATVAPAGTIADETLLAQVLSDGFFMGTRSRTQALKSNLEAKRDALRDLAARFSDGADPAFADRVVRACELDLLERFYIEE